MTSTIPRIVALFCVLQSKDAKQIVNYAAIIFISRSTQLVRFWVDETQSIVAVHFDCLIVVCHVMTKNTDFPFQSTSLQDIVLSCRIG